MHKGFWFGNLWEILVGNVEDAYRILVRRFEGKR
jgi:hypothetical protein